jgi:hypothetical protein
MVDTEKYSPEAQELIRLATADNPEIARVRVYERPSPDFDLAATLQARPDLMPGLNEYVKWSNEVSEAVDQAGQAKAVNHGLKGAIRKPPPK